MGTKLILRRLINLIREPVFIYLTILGHGIIFLGAWALWQVEMGGGTPVPTYLDALHWAISTVTTVGASSVAPTTTMGKFISMAMMICGCWLFWAYTALFAGALVAPEIKKMESDFRHLETEILEHEKG